MTELTIRDYLVETKDWKKDLKAFRDLKEAIDLDVLSTDIDDAATTELDEAYEEMSNTVTKKMADLVKADRDLGLFALSDNKFKSSIQYPEPFHGLWGENVFKFVKEITDAIKSDQIRKADKVRILMKYLKGNAKQTIGEHHISLTKAQEQLTDNYGSLRLIVDKYLKDY